MNIIRSALGIVLLPLSYAWANAHDVTARDSLRSRELDEVVVEEYRKIRQGNTFTISPVAVKQIPTLVGEPDLLRYLQVLPGVASGMEGGMGFFVRGANNGNSRVELDGVGVPAPTHLLGLFSTFHSDVIGQSELTMGGIPASSGDFLASLFSLRTHSSPTIDKVSGSVSFSPLMLGGSIDLPLVRQKLGLQVAARFSPLSAIVKAFESSGNDIDEDETRVSLNVSDFYGKLYWKPNRQHRIELMGYLSNDFFGMKDTDARFKTVTENEIGWGNYLAQLKWVYFLSEQWDLQTSLSYVRFTNSRMFSSMDKKRTLEGAKMEGIKGEVSLRSLLSYRPSTNLKLSTGFELKSMDYKPIKNEVFINQNRATLLGDKMKSTLSSIFADAVYQVNKQFSVRGGLRLGIYKPNNERLMSNIELRTQAKYALGSGYGLELSYDRMAQYQHQLEGLPVGWSLDVLIPATERFKPELSNQIYFGGYWGNRSWYATLGGYWRDLSQVVIYKSMLNLFGPRSVSWQDDLAVGEGRSYGLELWIEKRPVGRFSGSLSYTLSKTTRRYDEINGGKAFPFKFDRTHNLNLQLHYDTRISGRHRQQANISFYYSTGNRMTIPLSQYEGADLPYWTYNKGLGTTEGYFASIRYEMSEINAYKLPDYMRMDLSYSFLWKNRRTSHELMLSVYNVLNRHNPYLIFFEDNRWQQMSILPIVPSIRWELRF